MINELYITAAIKAIQQAMSAKSEEDGGKHIREAIQNLGKSLSSEVSLDIISAANYKPRDIKGMYVSSGCDWIDYLLGGGLRKEECMIIGGEFHVGKTHLMAYLAAQYLMEGQSVLHFNGEDILEDVLNVYKMSLVSGSGDANLEGLYFVNAMDSGVFSLEMIDRGLSTQKTDVVVVDHIDIMDSEIKNQDWKAVSDISRELKFLAKKYGNIIIVGSQAIEGRLFRGNASKSMHADVVWYLEEIVDNLLQVTVKKGRGRNIKNKKMALECNFDTMSIKSERI